jgi:hypothetical protein
MKRKILVRIDDYKKYVEENGTNIIDSNNEIYTNNSFPPKFIKERFNINEEIFEGKETRYDIIKDGEYEFLASFESISNIKYRLDLFREPITNIWHIGFSLFDSSLDNSYHNRTDKNESIDIFSRLIWILKDLDRNVEYCIGSTGDDSKDRVYEYMMRFVSNWDKRKTDQYELGWGIYFHL